MNECFAVIRLKSFRLKGRKGFRILADRLAEIGFTYSIRYVESPADLLQGCMNAAGIYQALVVGMDDTAMAMYRLIHGDDRLDDLVDRVAIIPDPNIQATIDQAALSARMALAEAETRLAAAKAEYSEPHPHHKGVHRIKNQHVHGLFGNKALVREMEELKAAIPGLRADVVAAVEGALAGKVQLLPRQ